MEDRLLDIVTIWAPAVLIVLSAVNACTKHYTRFNGVLRVILEVVERLSFLASRQTGRSTKPLLSSVEPDPSIERGEHVRKQLKEMAERKKLRRS
jgi:hypothetical protein